MTAFELLLEDTLKLHPNERALLAEELLKSLDAPDTEIDKIWKEESIKRYNAYKSNQINAKDLQDVLKKYNAHEN